MLSLLKFVVGSILEMQINISICDFQPGGNTAALGVIATVAEAASASVRVTFDETMTTTTNATTTMDRITMLRDTRFVPS